MATSPRVAVLSAVRTPIGKYGGALRTAPAVALGSLVAAEAIRRADIPPSDVPEGIFGQCLQAGAGQNPARQVLRTAGVPDTAGAVTVNMVCGSGLQAIRLAAAMVRSGEAPLLLVGGMESMSSAPFLVPAAVRWGLKPGAASLDDEMMRDSLLDAYGEHEQMGQTGERIAQKLGLKRAEVDAFAARSHQRAARASADGTFAAESIPVPAPLTLARATFERDEGPRGDSTVESLAKLKPSFRPDGLLTAGNSSQLSDGAAALILASEAEAARLGRTPIAYLHSSAVDGVAPSNVMEAPIPTVRKHLERVHVAPEMIDRVEHNEAFASASIAVQRAFQFPDDRFNVHGGAVALGHPIGSSGARIVVTLIHELRRSRTQLGLATLCMGGGNGLSLLVERE
ncbi:MAG TPA: acetyl-CoA C-acyltransferase [Thermoplasmata archaeon]|nr:acetyl-CoA C-acyltransferase [Thermoplasmata archaeon]